MTKLLSHKPKTDPALARYPQALAELLTFGEPEEDLEYEDWADQLGDYVPDLICMVLDDDLNVRDDDDPAWYAPVHAIEILCVLGPLEAADPLLACFDWDADWLYDLLPELYAAIGPASVPMLRDYLFDPSHAARARSTASDALMFIAQEHEAARSDVVALLTSFLDRPEADASADEEELTSFVICDLGDLGDASAYDAIRRAFEEDRVTPHIVGLSDIEQDFGMRPPSDFSLPLVPRSEPGVRLSLRCKACGREREHVFRTVYYDTLTRDNPKKREKYDPLVIPERVVCPKCGAVDQYELGAMGHIAITASMMAEMASEGSSILREDQRVKLVSFTTRWGPMHPNEAIERYERELARRPNDISLRIGLGNTLRMVGKLDEAEVEFQHVLDLDAQNLEAWEVLAQLAGERKNLPEAIRCWQQVLQLAPGAPLSRAERQELIEQVTRNLAELDSGVIPEYTASMGSRERAPQGRQVLPPPQLPAPAASSTIVSAPKIGRNERCPCGSGKKYKHCHGSKG
jgi:tetratricopeptide (TPR) repeat protein